MAIQYPNLPAFQIPSPGGVNINPGAVASAQMEAARMIAAPVQRAFEQMVGARIQERAAQQQMAFQAQQNERQIEEATLLRRMQDKAALERVEMTIAAEERKQAAQREMARAAGLAMRDMMRPLVPSGDGGASVGGAGGGVGTVGTGAAQPTLTLDGMAQIPNYPTISDEVAGVMGAENVAGVMSFRAGEQERARNNNEQAAKAAALRQKAEDEAAKLRSWQAGLLADDSISAADRLRILQRSFLNPNDAAEEYEAVVRANQTETAREREETRTGRFSETLAGVASTYPTSIREPKSKDAQRRFFSQMSSDEKAAVQLAATAAVARQLPGRSSLTVDDAAGLLNDTQFQGMYANQVAEAARNIALQFGWKPDPKREAPPAPVAATPPPSGGTEKGTPDDMRGTTQAINQQFGDVPVSLAASDEELRALMKAGKREEAARLLRERYNVHRQNVLGSGWPEPAPPQPEVLPSQRPTPNYLGDPTGWWWR